MVGNFNTMFSLPSFVKRVQKLTNGQKNAITQLGFGNVLKIPKLMLSKNLLVELMERWSPNKSAFRLPPGDIKITLMDITLILGLRATGKPVTLEDNLPFSELEKEYGASSKRKISIASIEQRLDSLDCIDDDDFMRSFLLFTFGVLLFPSTTKHVDSRYLSILADLDKVSDYAWGAAVLHDIIIWLCKRKETSVQNIGGCLIFLQIWCYEHIDVARPSLLHCSLSIPRVCRWNNIKRSLGREWFSTKFKELDSHQIIWELKPTCIEAKIDVVKELLKAECDTQEDDVQSEICLEQSVVDLENSRHTQSLREVIEREDSVELTPPLYTSIQIPVVNSGFVLISDVTELPVSLNTSIRIPEATPGFVLISDDEDEQSPTKKYEMLLKKYDDIRKQNAMLKYQCLEKDKEKEVLRNQCLEKDKEREVLKNQCLEKDKEKEVLKNQCLEKDKENEVLKNQCMELINEIEIFTKKDLSTNSFLAHLDDIAWDTNTSTTEEYVALQNKYPNLLLDSWSSV